MAEIQMVYFSEYCDSYAAEKFCHQCLTEYARGVECPSLCIGSDGSCIFAKLKRAYKGITVKNYTIEEQDWEDVYGGFTMEVSVRGGIYTCEKIILNGECIFDENARQKEIVEGRHAEEDGDALDANAGAAEGGGTQ